MKANRRKPMFICLWTYNPHYPFEAPEELIAKYRGKEGAGLKNPIYGAQIEATDCAVGRVLEAVDRLGMADNALVTCTSDNGGWDGATDNRPLRSGKGHLYEGGIRVPLIILSNDIGERKNLAGEKPELAAELDGQLRRWLVETRTIGSRAATLMRLSRSVTTPTGPAHSPGFVLHCGILHHGHDRGFRF